MSKQADRGVQQKAIRRRGKHKIDAGVVGSLNGSHSRVEGTDEENEQPVKDRDSGEICLKQESARSRVRQVAIDFAALVRQIKET